VTDPGLEHLAECKALTKLDLNQSKVTEAGVNKLHNALPNCRIEWGEGKLIEPEPKPKIPAGDTPPSKDAFPGKLVYFNTFDDPKTDDMPVLHAPAPPSVANGVFSWNAKGGSASLRPIATDIALCTRIRATNSHATISYRVRGTTTEGSWLHFVLQPSGRWSLGRNDMKTVDGNRVDGNVRLAGSEVDDPELAAGKWVNVAARAEGSRFDLWINGKVVATGQDTPPQPETGNWEFGVQFGLASEDAGTLEIDYAAVWDVLASPKLPGGPPKSK